ncbi:hypothetical protein FB451DRAFT_1360087 [Mycena latifolia]|nr:hypothetical protein FB451DRAFT_1360087 [Mycena latifolia]
MSSLSRSTHRLRTMNVSARNVAWIQRCQNRSPPSMPSRDPLVEPQWQRKPAHSTTSYTSDYISTSGCFHRCPISSNTNPCSVRGKPLPYPEVLRGMTSPYLWPVPPKGYYGGSEPQAQNIQQAWLRFKLRRMSNDTQVSFTTSLSWNEGQKSEKDTQRSSSQLDSVPLYTSLPPEVGRGLAKGKDEATFTSTFPHTSPSTSRGIPLPLVNPSCESGSRSAVLGPSDSSASTYLNGKEVFRLDPSVPSAAYSEEGSDTWFITLIFLFIQRILMIVESSLGVPGAKRGGMARARISTPAPNHTSTLECAVGGRLRPSGMSMRGRTYAYKYNAARGSLDSLIQGPCRMVACEILVSGVTRRHAREWYTIDFSGVSQDTARDQNHGAYARIVSLTTCKLDQVLGRRVKPRSLVACDEERGDLCNGGEHLGNGGPTYAGKLPRRRAAIPGRSEFSLVGRRQSNGNAKGEVAIQGLHEPVLQCVGRRGARRGGEVARFGCSIRQLERV